MPEIIIHAEAMSDADPDTLFALLKDGATWPTWSLFTGFELEAPGVSDPLGVGCIRIFRTRVTRVREQVTEIEAGRRLGYVLLSGLPLHDYRAVVALARVPGGGCHIQWTASFRAASRWTDWFWRWFMRRVLRAVARQLASAMDRCAAGPMLHAGR